jgi:hypothetical protein
MADLTLSESERKLLNNAAQGVHLAKAGVFDAQAEYERAEQKVQDAQREVFAAEQRMAAAFSAVIAIRGLQGSYTVNSDVTELVERNGVG